MFMYTLLFLQQQKQARNVLRVRFLVVILQTCFVLGVFFCIALIPSYVHVTAAHIAMKEKIATQEVCDVVEEGGEQVQEGDRAEREYVQAVFTQHCTLVLPTDVFDEVNRVVGKIATLRSMSYVAEKQSVVLEGAVSDEETLVALVEALDTSKHFVGVPRITEVLRQDPAAFRLQVNYVH
jgi:hypothetical protein